MRDPSSYIAGLTAYRDGQPTSWVDTFVGFLAGACAYSLLLTAALGDLTGQWAGRISDIKRNAVDHQIVPALIEHPVLDSTFIAERFGVSLVAARGALERLTQRGVLVERPLRKGRRGRSGKLQAAAFGWAKPPCDTWMPPLASRTELGFVPIDADEEETPGVDSQ